MSKNDNIIHIPEEFTKETQIIPGTLPYNSKKLDNGNGGEPPMDKYVTHQELEASTEKILHQMDKHFADMQQQIDNRFNEIDLEINKTKNVADSANWKSNWILGILSASVVGVVVAAITTLLHFH